MPFVWIVIKNVQERTQHTTRFSVDKSFDRNSGKHLQLHFLMKVWNIVGTLFLDIVSSGEDTMWLFDGAVFVSSCCQMRMVLRVERGTAT